MLRIAVAGSTGLLGSALVTTLEADGHSVVRLVRPETTAPGIAWDPARGTIDRGALDGFDAVVNLSGRSIGERRWNEREKALVRSSRVEGTALLAGAIASLDRPPAVWLNASAIGYYGDRPGEALSEQDGPGDGFLAEVTVEWEQAAAPAAEAGTRVVLLRNGIVLSDRGGALHRMLAPFGPSWLSPFRWGLGGRLGGGRTVWSWVSLEDAVAAMVHLLQSDVAGPVNLTAPAPVTNTEFTKALGRVLRRPAVLPIPKFVLDVVLGGELADTLLFTSQHVLPGRLDDDGFRFRHDEVEPALRAALGR
jgi:uncharacterized protein (TIGR01777 family)